MSDLENKIKRAEDVLVYHESEECGCEGFERHEDDLEYAKAKVFLDTIKTCSCEAYRAEIEYCKQVKLYARLLAGYLEENPKIFDEIPEHLQPWGIVRKLISVLSSPPGESK